MKSDLGDYQRKFAQFPERIRAEIAAIEKRLEVMRRMLGMLEKPPFKKAKGRVTCPPL